MTGFAHEAFWTAIATGAPVIGLAHAVVLERATTRANSRGEQIRVLTEQGRWAGVPLWRRALVQFLATTPPILALAGLVAAVLAFVGALVSLYRQADFATAWSAALLLASFAAVAVVSLLLAAGPWLTNVLTRASRPRPTSA